MSAIKLSPSVSARNYIPTVKGVQLLKSAHERMIRMKPRARTDDSRMILARGLRVNAIAEMFVDSQCLWQSVKKRQCLGKQTALALSWVQGLTAFIN